ncbi:MAG: hypothetical protein IJZ04_03705 [Clostridia bacterium]|nr:hypothetical protein [Clostridia bacterium]
MKKLLSLILALIMCFVTLISCGNEENSSSQSETKSESSSESVSQIQSGTESASEIVSEESNTETQSETSEDSSSSEKASSSENDNDSETSTQNQITGIVGYDSNGWPIIKTSQNQLSTYTVGLKYWIETREPNPIKEYLSSPVIENFSDFTEFLTNATLKTSIDEITESTFDDNIVIVVYRSFDSRMNLQYYNFEIQDDNIYLSYEYTIFTDVIFNKVPGKVDFVVIPRELCDLAKVNTSEIYFKDVIVHEYQIENLP